MRNVLEFQLLCSVLIEHYIRKQKQFHFQVIDSLLVAHKYVVHTTNMSRIIIRVIWFDQHTHTHSHIVNQLVRSYYISKRIFTQRLSLRFIWSFVICALAVASQINQTDLLMVIWVDSFHVRISRKFQLTHSSTFTTCRRMACETSKNTNSSCSH